MTSKCGYFIAVIRVVAFLSLATTTRIVPAETDTRLPIPSQEDVAKAQELIRAAYQTELQAAMEAREPAPLLGQLRSAADATDDPVRKYALLLEAREIASQFDDAEATLAFVDRLSEGFKIDALLERSQVQDKLAGPRIVPDLPLLKEAQITATKAAADQRYDIAEKSATLAVSIAQAIDRAQKAAVRPGQRKPAAHVVVPDINGPHLIRSARELQARLRRESKLHEAYLEAMRVLDTQPEDAAANAAAANYLCFIAEDWKRGLPHLSKSVGLPLSGLAQEELQLLNAEAKVPDKLFGLASRWWAAVEKSTDAELAVDPVRRHATGLYRDVIQALEDPLQIKLAISRIRECKPSLAEPRDDGSRTITLIAHGHIVEEVSPADGWTEHDGFFEGRGRVVGRGSKASGNPSVLGLTRNLGTHDFVVELEISVEVKNRTASSFEFRANQKAGRFGLDSNTDETFIEGSLFQITSRNKRTLAQGRRYRIVFQRLGDEITWSIDGLPTGAVRLTEATIEEFHARPHRGCLRIFNATLTYPPRGENAGTGAAPKDDQSCDTASPEAVTEGPD